MASCEDCDAETWFEFIQADPSTEHTFAFCSFFMYRFMFTVVLVVQTAVLLYSLSILDPGQSELLSRCCVKPGQIPVHLRRNMTFLTRSQADEMRCDDAGHKWDSAGYRLDLNK